ncbi:hypothetical protein [Blastococcus sp. SYSU DS0617]
MEGFWLGTALATVAWAPTAAWLLVRRWDRLDRWFLVAVGWGVVVAGAVVGVGGGARSGTAGAGAPTWLLGETLVFWIGVTLVGTRRRTPR